MKEYEVMKTIVFGALAKEDKNHCKDLEQYFIDLFENRTSRAEYIIFANHEAFELCKIYMKIFMEDPKYSKSLKRSIEEAIPKMVVDNFLDLYSSEIKEKLSFLGRRGSFVLVNPIICCAMAKHGWVLRRFASFWRHEASDKDQGLNYQVYEHYYMSDAAAKVAINNDVGIYFSDEYTDSISPTAKVVRLYNLLMVQLKRIGRYSNCNFSVFSICNWKKQQESNLASNDIDSYKVFKYSRGNYLLTVYLRSCAYQELVADETVVIEPFIFLPSISEEAYARLRKKIYAKWGISETQKWEQGSRTEFEAMLLYLNLSLLANISHLTDNCVDAYENMDIDWFEKYIRLGKNEDLINRLKDSKNLFSWEELLQSLDEATSNSTFNEFFGKQPCSLKTVIEDGIYSWAHIDAIEYYRSFKNMPPATSYSNPTMAKMSKLINVYHTVPTPISKFMNALEVGWNMKDTAPILLRMMDERSIVFKGLKVDGKYSICMFPN